MTDKTYKELAELAAICADEARASTSHDVAQELWRTVTGISAACCNDGKTKIARHRDPPGWAH
jgi:hypothetical protein